jgi:Na+-transporting methylmalonyl-CoA/oxaloacetate decarboxylase gamma subunit
MLGIAAITANNGWAMAITGAAIVMSGLAILAFVISQLHKIIALFEGKKKNVTSSPPQAPQKAAKNYELDLFDDLPAAAKIYQSLTLDLGEVFPLATLYKVFEKEDIPHPHITIRAFRDAGFLVPVEEGKFAWKNI